MQIRSDTTVLDPPLPEAAQDECAPKPASRKFLAISLLINLVFIGLLLWRAHQNGWYLSTQRLAGNTNLALQTIRLELFRLSDSAHTDEPLVVMFGDSLTYGGLWPEWFGGQVWNRGIGGDTTADALRRVDEIVALRPSVVFIEFGTNDVGVLTSEQTARNIRGMVTTLRTGLPNSKIVVMGLLPGRTLQRTAIAKELNAHLVEAVGSENFLDMTEAFSTPTGVILPQLTTDGTHLTPEGYRRWCSVFDVKFHGGLLPYSRFHLLPTQASAALDSSQSRPR